ncbi:HPr family phosphocarrier protein [Acuticoccus sp. I52.16.1]|uniref:HPr family phosphocarrier protein n=1 Tax=Acuticoccus sp. I52.16.1 TaxID=2928472 RepID=UPI001FD079E8|nr:HPr family phosphocarrier protein [Acuticoccus sp. I52.16.1]UOM35777.1 HPr family phosphocarrier protein [Acuticoccus sp. I52.16.1]
MTGPAAAPASSEWTEGAATIVDPTGLHARPAVKLTKLAKTFAAAVEVRAESDERWTNAKSPNSVMKMKAAHGSALHIRAAGEDAEAAVAALVALVEANFDA